MKVLLPAIVLLLLSTTSFAQTNSASVSGKVIDNYNHPASSASVSLFRVKDSTVSKAAITNNDGDFVINNIKPGKYFISVTSVGLKKSASAVFELKEKQSYFLAPIKLIQNDKRLSDVNVDSKRPIIETTPDKVIYNVENSINATGSNAFELLQKSPGVTIDKDENIFLKGKNGVRIYIDGKISQIAGKYLAEYLKAINSADIESIEMISNPSAKYDASGNAGIINIRLKRNKNFGTNATISAGVAIAHTPKENSSFNFNHRNKWINFFATYSNNFGKRRTFFDLYRIQNDTVYDQHSINETHPRIHNFKTGMDVFIDPKNTIGFIINGNFHTNDLNTTGSTVISKNNSSAPTKILYASDLQPVKRSNMNYNINYRYVNKSTELDIDGDAGFYRSTAQSYQPNEYRDPVTNALINEKIYQNYTPTDIDIKTIKADFVTLIKKGKLEIGGKYSNVETKNTFDFYNVINGSNMMDSSRSNKFNYTENVNAAYVNYSTPLSNKLNIRAGIRIENTVSEGNLISYHPQPDDDVKRNYLDLFPSGGISFTADKNNSFNLSYSRRIDRPNYEDLNPFENKIDELTYQKGNAFLRPQYTNIIELTHTFMSRFNTTLSYSHIKDYRANIIDTTENNRVYRTVKNLASQDIYNLNITAPFPITKWWNAFFTFNGYRSLYKADFGIGKIINAEVYAYSFFSQQIITLKEGLTFEVSGSYNSPNIYGGTFKTDGSGNADAGLQLMLFEKKGSIKVSYTDIFQTLKFRGVSNFGGAYIIFDSRGETKQLRINFTYHFGNRQVKASQHKTGIEEENKRLNQ